MKMRALLAILSFSFVTASLPAREPADWLVDSSNFKARVTQSKDGREVILENGLVRRTFRLAPNAATVGFENLMTGESIIRAVRPEAELSLNGEHYEVGGLRGQPVQNYLKPEWIKTLTASSNAFQFTGFTTGKTQARLAWKKRAEWMPRDVPWPPPGVSLTLQFQSPTNLPDVVVEVHYELFDGIPLVSKWLTVHNRTGQPVRVDSFVSEILATVEAQSLVGDTPSWRLPNLYVETDYAFGGAMGEADTLPGVHWTTDTQYTSQVNVKLETPCLLQCRPSLGPDQEIAPGSTFESFRAFEMAYDSTDRERNGLAKRRMYRVIAPWVTENPILMHVRSAEPDAVKLAIDQCAEVGFEMVIMTFGSGFKFESRDGEYQRQIRELADYAKAKGIALGGYSLLASRGAATKVDNTIGPTKFGVMPCLGAQWGVDYLAQLKEFITTAGLGVLEHDGSYPGDTCAATNHPFHKNLADSQWVQWRAITDLYKWCRAGGVYLNVPDWYYLSGSSKCGMGYREKNWALPREYQEIIERQNIFDGTWEKTPSMGWMFVPLTGYHKGGDDSTIEPLREHLPHYEQRLANLFGAGVIACYRGPRLYDSVETKTVVKRWVDFYKQHRDVLNADILHLRRADGRDLDYILHVNPAGKEKALLMVYNPLDRAVKKEITVPLHYAGLRSRTNVRERDGVAKKFSLDGNANGKLSVSVPAKGVTWFVFD